MHYGSPPAPAPAPPCPTPPSGPGPAAATAPSSASPAPLPPLLPEGGVLGPPPHKLDHAATASPTISIHVAAQAGLQHERSKLGAAHDRCAPS